MPNAKRQTQGQAKRQTAAKPSDNRQRWFKNQCASAKRQTAAIKSGKRKGEPMWRLNNHNCGKAKAANERVSQCGVSTITTAAKSSGNRKGESRGVSTITTAANQSGELRQSKAATARAKPSGNQKGKPKRRAETEYRRILWQD